MYNVSQKSLKRILTFHLMKTSIQYKLQNCSKTVRVNHMFMNFSYHCFKKVAHFKLLYDPSIDKIGQLTFKSDSACF